MAGEDQPDQSGMNYIPYDLGRAPSSGYSAEHYRFLNELIESKTAKEFFVQIWNTDFSAQCINAFYKILTSGFDKNAMLARNVTSKDIRLRMIDFDIALNLMVIECNESDIQNPAFLTFRENIRQAFGDFVSRSQTERDQLLRQEFGPVTPVPMGQGSPAQQTRQQPQSKGPFGIGRGNS